MIIFYADIIYLVKLRSNHYAALSPENLENISNFEGGGLTLVAYKKSVFIKILLFRVFNCQKLFWRSLILLAVTIGYIKESFSANVKKSSFYKNQKGFILNILFEK